MCSVCIITELQPPGFKNKLSQSSSRKSSSNTHARVHAHMHAHTQPGRHFTQRSSGDIFVWKLVAVNRQHSWFLWYVTCTQATDSGKSSVLVKPASRLHSLGSSRELWQVWQSTWMTRWQTLMWRAGEKFCAKANIPVPCDCRDLLARCNKG